VFGLPARAQTAHVVEAVQFRSLDDGRTMLRGYLFRPARATGRRPAMVLMHGRSGAYSSTARGVYTAETLRRRDRQWAEQWAELGYVALIVDSFGPRGYPRGFAAGTHGSRPAEVDEVTVRPLDAYGALAFLRRRPDIDPNRIGLMGWSNGGSAVLVALAEPHGAGRFRIGIAFYPGCGLGGRYREGYRPYAEVLIFTAENDEEVSAAACRGIAEASDAVTVIGFPGATHDFDDPANSRQDLPANRDANRSAREQVLALTSSFMGR
jgi:carboxymethylenebutenolidase